MTLTIKTEALIESTLKANISDNIGIVSIEQHTGPQGHSGAAIEYYDVAYFYGDSKKTIRLVMKEASLAERKNACAPW